MIEIPDRPMMPGPHQFTRSFASSHASIAGKDECTACGQMKKFRLHAEWEALNSAQEEGK